MLGDMKRSLILLGLLAFSFAFTAAPAQAEAPKNLGKFGYWEAYQLGEGEARTCYMTLRAKPPIPKGSKLKRGEVTMMLTHRPAEGALDVFSYDAGTKFKPASDVAFQVGDTVYGLFTQGNTAWARDSITDKEIANALRKGQSITITGTAATGGPFADTIALKGSADAYRAMSKACAIPVPDEPQSPTPAAKKPSAKKK